MYTHAHAHGGDWGSYTGCVPAGCSWNTAMYICLHCGQCHNLFSDEHCHLLLQLLYLTPAGFITDRRVQLSRAHPGSSTIMLYQREHPTVLFHPLLAVESDCNCPMIDMSNDTNPAAAWQLASLSLPCSCQACLALLNSSHTASTSPSNRVGNVRAFLSSSCRSQNMLTICTRILQRKPSERWCGFVKKWALYTLCHLSTDPTALCYGLNNCRQSRWAAATRSHHVCYANWTTKYWTTNADPEQGSSGNNNSCVQLSKRLIQTKLH